MIIAIDGPAASGKSTIGSLLAKKLGYLYFDTGVMYRAVTFESLAQSIPVRDEIAVTELAKEIRIDCLAPEIDDGRDMTILVDGHDVTREIRSREVEVNVSAVSAYRGVREEMVKQQRRIGKQGDIVMVGRDIGTIVLPEADLKIYLDASVEERAQRRLLEKRQRGERVEYDAILREIKNRDEIDSNRTIAPLTQAKDAVYVDTTGSSIPLVLERVMTIAMDQKK